MEIKKEQVDKIKYYLSEYLYVLQREYVDLDVDGNQEAAEELKEVIDEIGELLVLLSEE